MKITIIIGRLMIQLNHHIYRRTGIRKAKEKIIMEKFINKLIFVLTVLFFAIICVNGAVKAGDYLAIILYAYYGNYVG